MTPEARFSVTDVELPTASPVEKRERPSHKKNGQARDSLVANGTPPTLEHLGFWDQLNALTESQLQYHRVYLYRIEPPIRNAGDKNFIERRSQPFDENDVLASHGSGTYLAILNNTRERRTVGKITFSCHHPEAPPKIRLAQLAPEADESWRKWLEEVEARKSTFGTSPPGAAVVQQSGENQVAMEAIRKVDAVNQRLLETKEAAAVKSGPTIDASVVTLITETAKGRDQLAEKLAASVPTSGDSSMLQFVLGELRETRAQHAEEMKQMRQQHFDLMNQLVTLKGEQTKQPSTLEQVKQMGEVISTFASVIPQATSMEPWQQLLVDTVPKAADMVEKLVSMNALNRRMSAPATASRPGGAPQTGPPPLPATAPSANAAPENSAAQNPIPEMDIMTKTLFVAIADNAAAALKLGIAGDEFAERLCDNFGPRTYDNFIEQNTKETLLPLFASIPEAWTLLQPFEPALAKFLDEFYAFADEQPDEEAPPPPAAPIPESAEAKAKPAAKRNAK